MYTIMSKKGQFVINHKTYNVDSRLEEKVIRRLILEGYSECLNKPVYGLKVNNFKYTPDLQLDLIYQDEVRVGLVEIKPNLSDFTKDISHRMRAVANIYNNTLLLLYIDRGRCWYEINPLSGSLTKIKLPKAANSSNISYQSQSLLFKSIILRGKCYKIRLKPISLFAKIIVRIIEWLLPY